MLSRGDDSLAALPVFLSRMFRQSAIFVKSKSSIRSVHDLRGRRVGVVDWTQTAGIYVRGYMAHDCGVPLDSIDWVQAGLNEPGIRENAAFNRPAGLSLVIRSHETLDELLADGEIDALISPQPPRSAEGPEPRTARLTPADPVGEADYYKRTGIFPIMHVLVLRRDVFEANPSVGASLCAAFHTAKEHSVRRMSDLAISRYPLPWLGGAIRRSASVFGRDIWPYGIEPNRRTLEAFLAYAFEQGVAARELDVDELFVEDVPVLAG
jgi:4,5-dihydroxyphthalate decarboxylase